MTPDEHLDHLARDSEAFAVAAERDLGAAVPSCPEWTVADLVWHMGNVAHTWGEIAGRRVQAPKEVVRDDRPADDALVAWYRLKADELAHALRSGDPSEARWTWSTQKDLAFIQRRMAQEILIHRFDAEESTGEPASLDPLVAADGIDEFLAFFLGPTPEQGSVHLHCHDTTGEWLVTFDGKGGNVVLGHEKGDAAMRGTAEALLLALWRRAPLSSIEVLGDTELVERFVAMNDL